MPDARSHKRLYRCPHCGDVLSYPPSTYYWCPAIGRKFSDNPEDKKYDNRNRRK